MDIIWIVFRRACQVVVDSSIAVAAVVQVMKRLHAVIANFLSTLLIRSGLPGKQTLGMCCHNRAFIVIDIARIVCGRALRFWQKKFWLDSILATESIFFDSAIW